MKKTGILNGELARIIASMGHSDRLVICDCGLPLPQGSRVVDLALTTNIPRFLETVGVVMAELEVEKLIVAREMVEESQDIYDGLVRMANGAVIDNVPHEVFKELVLSGENVSFVRTGEATPYANVILVSGVTF